MIPKIFHQTAASSVLSWEERRLSSRLRRIHPSWEYRFWDDRQNRDLFIGIFPEFLPKFDAIKYGVVRSDVCRYLYLYAVGGFYLDTDYKIFREIDEGLLSFDCVLPLEWGIPPRLNSVNQNFNLGNAVLGSVSKFPMWRDFVLELFSDERLLDIPDREAVPEISGPAGLSRFIEKRLGSYGNVYFPEKNSFYPDIKNFALRTSRGSETFGVHYCWGSWRGRKILDIVKTVVRRKLNGL